MSLTALAALAALGVTLAACGGPSQPTGSATVAPAATANGAPAAPAAKPTSAPAAPAAKPVAPAGVPTADAGTSDVQDAFLTNVNDLTSDVQTLATASCEDLTAETRDNPTEVTEIRGFAATLQRVGASQAALQSDDVRTALDALSKALSQLDTALNTCGIKQP